jgi:hypothetical protein
MSGWFFDRMQLTHAARVRGKCTHAKAVLYYLVCRGDREGRSHASLQTMADEMEISVDSVERGLKRLCAVGVVKTSPRRDKRGRITTNNYVVVESVLRTLSIPHGADRSIPHGAVSRSARRSGPLVDPIDAITNHQVAPAPGDEYSRHPFAHRSASVVSP